MLLFEGPHPRTSLGDSKDAQDIFNSANTDAHGQNHTNALKSFPPFPGSKQAACWVRNTKPKQVSEGKLVGTCMFLTSLKFFSGSYGVWGCARCSEAPSGLEDSVLTGHRDSKAEPVQLSTSPLHPDPETTLHSTFSQAFFLNFFCLF